MPWYRTGKVAITAGQSTVIGNSTNFSANARVGDAFQGPDGRWYEVTNIASSTVLSILPVYQGETVTAGNYGIAPMQGYVKESADRLRQITDGMESIEADVDAAHQSVLAAEASATAAGAYASQASQDRAAAESASGAAQSSQQAAAGSSTSAAQSAQDALGYRSSAQTSATQAGDSADAAAASAAAAAESEHNVSHKANSGANSDITSLSGLTTPLSVNQGGTGGGTAADARASLGLKSAALAEIVGTVSQSGGVPTGAIIEHGSNASGDYVKYADGTLLCWKILSVTTAVNSAAGSVFFSGALDGGAWPAAFTARPVRLIHTDGGSWANSSTTGWDANNVGNFQVVRYISTSSTTYSVSIFGIGRWF